MRSRRVFDKEREDADLVATQADVEEMEVLCAFGGEARPDGQRGHVAQGPEVKGQCAVVLRVREGAVAVAARVFLKERKTNTC